MQILLDKEVEISEPVKVKVDNDGGKCLVINRNGTEITNWKLQAVSFSPAFCTVILKFAYRIRMLFSRLEQLTVNKVDKKELIQAL